MIFRNIGIYVKINLINLNYRSKALLRKINYKINPIMGGKADKVDRILNAIKIVRNVDTEYKYDIETILYAFASKFLEGKDLEKVREEIKMTELGRSLIKEGKQENTIEVAKRAIKEGMSDEIISKLTELTIEQIKIIRKTIETN